MENSDERDIKALRNEPMNVIGFEGFDPDAAEWDEDDDDDIGDTGSGGRPKKRRSIANLSAKPTDDAKRADGQRTPSASDDDLKNKNQRRKIRIEFIEDKSRRHITFSKRKAGIMKKAYELSTLTGTQVLLLVVSETGLVYTFTTAKLQPLVTQELGKRLIQMCLNTADGDVPNFNKAAMAAAASAAAAAGMNQPASSAGGQRYVSGGAAPAPASAAPNAPTNPNLAMLSQLGISPNAAAAAVASNSAPNDFSNPHRAAMLHGAPSYENLSSNKHQLHAQLGLGSASSAPSNDHAAMAAAAAAAAAHQRRTSDMGAAGSGSAGGPLLNKTNRPIAGTQRVASNAALLKQPSNDRIVSQGHNRMVSSPLNVQLGNLELRSASSSKPPPHLTLDTNVNEASSRTEYLLSAMSAHPTMGQENRFPTSATHQKTLSESGIELNNDHANNEDSNRQFAELLQSGSGSASAHSPLFQQQQQQPQSSSAALSREQQQMLLGLRGGSRGGPPASSSGASNQAGGHSRQLSSSASELTGMQHLLDPSSAMGSSNQHLPLSPHVRSALQQLHMQQGSNAPSSSQQQGSAASPDPSGGAGLAMYYDSAAIGKQGSQENFNSNIFAPRAGGHGSLNSMLGSGQNFDSGSNIQGLMDYNNNEYGQNFSSQWPHVDLGQPIPGGDVSHLWMFPNQSAGELSLSPVGDRDIK